MTTLKDRRYSISEVSQLLDLPASILRQWEKQITEINPKRDNQNRRYYQPQDIQNIKRIKHFVRTEKMTLQGAALNLSRELTGESTPQTSDEALELIDKIEQKARKILDTLDQYDDK